MLDSAEEAKLNALLESIRRQKQIALTIQEEVSYQDKVISEISTLTETNQGELKKQRRYFEWIRNKFNI